MSSASSVSSVSSVSSAKRTDQHLCIKAICSNQLEIVKLFSRYGKIYSFSDLRCAVFWGSEEVVSYLLNKHTYPLNTEYSLRYEESNKITPEIVKLLLDHGADPATRMCSATSANAIMAAIPYRHLEVVARYLRRGVDIDLRSWAYQCGHVTPFEASVLHGHYYISVMLSVEYSPTQVRG